MKNNSQHNSRHPAPLRRHAGSPLRELRSPPSIFRVAMFIAAAVPLLAVLLIVVPWQQSAVGSGKVFANDPQDRAQEVESPIKGVLLQWHVREGDWVRAGDPLVEIADNDEQRPLRLTQLQHAAQAALVAVQMQLTSYENKHAAEQARKDLALAELDSRIAEQVRKRVAEEAEVQTAEWNLARVTTLESEGLDSRRNLELAGLTLSKAQAKLRARDATLQAAYTAKDRTAQEATARIASVEADVRATEGKVAKARASVTSMSTAMARFERRIVTAPRDGTVLRIHGAPGGGQVKQGDLLLRLVPKNTSRAVELWLDGNDVALVNRGDDVRLVFEGWPAVQFVGLPGATGGTFAGKVAFVDAADDKGNGKFRAVVLPTDDESSWPDGARLRQGVRAKGFVILDTVPLGYELWRQLNGFPPLPRVRKGKGPALPTSKKPRIPTELKP